MNTDGRSARRARTNAAASPALGVIDAAWLALLGATLLGGCGAGTAAVVSGGGGGSGGNAPSAMSELSVLDPKEPSAARVRFVLSDGESDPAQVELFYQVPGSAPQPLTQVGQNPMTLATSPDGLEHQLPWNFAAEVALPDDAHFVPGVRVIASVQNGLQEIVLGANDDFGLGNDPPVVSGAEPPAPEVDGVVPVRFSVSDSSDDLVSVKVEFDVVGDTPDLGWRIARPGGLLSNDSTPELAFPAVEGPVSGADLVFFWDTDFDLAELERDVRVRFTAEDEVVAGPAAETPVFRVDNNEEPIATISDGLLVLNPDQRAGIPIPYIVRDEESDEVQVVLQWKRPNEEFPPLPDTPAEINAILADPVQRRERHICSEYPTWVEGRVVPIDSTSVRLPELATSASSILAHSLVGLELEILRASKIPGPIAATWASNPLNHPVAALPVGDGIEALVLDRAGFGAWRVRQIDLATGIVTHELVSSAPGEPNAMAIERDEQSVLIASDVGGAWQLARVKLADGGIIPLIEFDGTTEAGAIRGLASQGANSALVTVASSLIRLDYSELRSPRSVTLFDDLSTPWGVVLDPLNTNRIYLAERDADTLDGTGQILSIQLDTLERLPIVALPAAILDDVYERAFNRPQALALDRSGSRLLAITQREPDGGPWSLEAIDLGGAGENRAFQLLSDLPGPADSIAVGTQGLLVLALAADQDLHVGGGVEQRRTIDGFDIARRDVHVSAGFSPALSATQAFRIRKPSLVGRPSPSGTRDSFVWDSADLLGSGPVKFRAVPMDAERGIEGSTEAAKLIRSGFDTDPVALGNPSATNGPYSVTAADLDGDGDLDLASANYFSNKLRIFFQESTGVFGSSALVSLGNASVTNGPRSVTAADLDGDGDLDLASANYLGNTLTVFFQESPGVFGATPFSLGNASVTNQPYSVVAADLDGDGDLDLASANNGGHTLTVFFQASPGVFGSTPLSLGNASVTSYPQSITAADLDGDGDLDLASANQGSGTLTVFFQTSPGVFGATPLSVGNIFVTNGVDSVTAADLDGDGDIDLACASYGISRLAIFFQESPGVFGSSPLLLGNASVTNTPTCVTAADIDGDGDLDLASAHLSDTLTVFFQVSPGVFGSTPLTLGNTSVTDLPLSVTAADLDGDGDLDLASANAVSNTLTVFFQERSGGLGSTPLSLGDQSATPYPQSVTAADLDGDGDLDLASGNFGSLTVFFQESPAVFGSTPLSLEIVNEGFVPVSVTAGDLDGDGDLDLASANASSNSLIVFFQESPGVFGTTPLSLSLGNAGVTNQPLSVAAADLDGDGDLDLASANASSNSLIVFFQESPGVFGTTPLSLSLGNAGVTNQPLSVAAADLDGDGDLDLASANELSNTLTVFFQERPGVFGAAPLSLGDASVTNSPRSVTAADLDGDGDLDLASANAGSNTLTVFFQESPGVFGSAPLSLGNSSVTNSPYSVTAGDFDGDGDIDLASANYLGSTLTVFFQERSGVFGSAVLSLGDAGVTNVPFSVTAADVDGDGDLDLASANESSSTLTVFWNNH